MPIANPLKADPTRTTPIRRRFEAELGRRFSSLTTALHTLLVREDALGLVANQRWAFETNERKLRSFRSWLRYWSAQNILGTDAEQPERPWTANYVYPAYRRGAERAITDARKTKARESVLAALAEGAVSRERLQLLYLRSFEDLQGVTYSMSVQMSKILAAGLVAGDNPRTIARRMAEQVGLSRRRALMIARTEVVYAHAEGQLDAFQQMGIEQVDAQVEWLTADDGRVCLKCRDLAGRTYTVAEARGLIPAHVNCRCCWSPVLVESEEGPARRDRLAAAVRQSARQGLPA